MTGMIGFAGLAGILSILSPCVLPIVPIVLGAAVSEHRFGPLALASGLALSFTAIGVVVAVAGFAVGLDAGVFRTVGAVLMVGLGAILFEPRWQAWLVIAVAPIGNWTQGRFGGFSSTGLGGQFGVGLLLGAVWSPCVGPTLGAASLMAARGESLGAVVATMLAFGIGAALPLLGLGVLSRGTILHWRDRLLTTGKGVKQGMGIVLIAIGVLILSGLDKQVEAYLVEASPAWLTDITTRF